MLLISSLTSTIVPVFPITFRKSLVNDSTTLAIFKFLERMDISLIEFNILYKKWGLIWYWRAFNSSFFFSFSSSIALLNIFLIWITILLKRFWICPSSSVKLIGTNTLKSPVSTFFMALFNSCKGTAICFDMK